MYKYFKFAIKKIRKIKLKINYKGTTLHLYTLQNVHYFGVPYGKGLL